MKQIEIIKPVNNQEDEDGYTIYPADELFDESKKEQDTTTRNNNVYLDFSPAKSLFRSFTQSQGKTD